VKLSQTISIPITDDLIFEGNETFTVALSDPTGGAGLGSIPSTTVTITDNETKPTLSINDVTQAEGMRMPR